MIPTKITRDRLYSSLNGVIYRNSREIGDPVHGIVFNSHPAEPQYAYLRFVKKGISTGVLIKFTYGYIQIRKR